MRRKRIPYTTWIIFEGGDALLDNNGLVPDRKEVCEKFPTVL